MNAPETDNDIIPLTVADALAKWDANQTVFTVQMGGLGPGYDMAIAALAFELMRVWQDVDFTANDFRARLESLAEPVIHRCNDEPWGGFSGAQVGTAQRLASNVCRRGYRIALRDNAVKDRLIQVCKLDLRSGSES
jgi:hypothetical protein